MFEQISTKSFDNYGLARNQTPENLSGKSGNDFYSMVLSHRDIAESRQENYKTVETDDNREKPHKTENFESRNIEESRGFEQSKDIVVKNNDSSESEKGNREKTDPVEGIITDNKSAEKSLDSINASDQKEMIVNEELISEAYSLLRDVINGEVKPDDLTDEQVSIIIRAAFTAEQARNTQTQNELKNHSELQVRELLLNDKNLKNSYLSLFKGIIEKITENISEKKKLTGLSEDDIKKLSDKIISGFTENNKKLPAREILRYVLRSAENVENKSELNTQVNDRIKLNLTEEDPLSGKKSFNSNEKGESRDTFNFNLGRSENITRKNFQPTDMKSGTPEFRQSLQDIIDRARITVRDNRNGSFNVKLYPRELGNVNVNLSLENGIITARFLVDSDDAKNLLSQNMESLKQQLREAGIDLGEFHVNVNDQGRRFLNENDHDRRKELKNMPDGKETIMAAIEYDSNAPVLSSGSINVII